jgi:hypothetical protein
VISEATEDEVTESARSAVATVAMAVAKERPTSSSHQRVERSFTAAWEAAPPAGETAKWPVMEDDDNHDAASNTVDEEEKEADEMGKYKGLKHLFFSLFLF